MKNTQPRVLLIHDLSGFGRCSLTVALPILSAMGVECVCVPTASLSAHTAIDGYTYRDLTADLPATLAHYQQLGLRFDAIYSGFLGSTAQIAAVRAFVDAFRTDGCRFVCDPAMADDGALYPTFDAAFVREMRALCTVADVILPNRTESALLLGRPYAETFADEKSARDQLAGLHQLTCAQVVLTGVERDGQIGAGVQTNTGAAFHYAPRSGDSFCGSGDVFASVFVGGLLCGKTTAEAAKQAVDFTASAVAATHKAGGDPRFGLQFEPLLGTINNLQ
ncbi:MAG: pyridoxamine kinase [Oscillospiraceae bacterium]|jgi:pyridoxine kinase|nr:pyridoxamine kinase [Oscillospiraceae bacterium]